MWRLLPLIALAAVCLAELAQPPATRIHYYVQLIRATDSSLPPQPDSHPVGAKLAVTLNGPLRWTHYWEVCRHELDVPLGRKARSPLANHRSVEIDLTRPGKRNVVAFQDGKSLGCTVLPVGQALTLIGGDRDDTTGWFIVVRRDKPGA